jgi:tetratricopeptide (TPR) repeat protein
LRQGHLAEGRILAEEVLAHDPQHPQALSVLGDFFLKEPSPPQAWECFRQAFFRDPRPYLILKTARALKEMGNFAEALQELEKVLVVQRENFPFLKEKALILNRMKKFDQALDCYEKVKDKGQGSKVIPLQGKLNLKKGISYTMNLKYSDEAG